MTDATIPKPKRIPTSPSVLWRDVRVRILPVLVFGAIVALLASQWHRLDGGGIPGVAEGVRSVVTAPQLGLLQHVHVKPYQWVQAGEPVATFLPNDARAKFDLLQTELQIARLRLQPTIADQNALDFERLRVDYLRLKQELAEARVNLQRAENTLRRNTQLLRDKLISEEAYDLSVRDRDLYVAEIREKTSSSEEIEARMSKLRSLGEPDQAGTNDPSRAILAELDARLTQAGSNWCPLPLIAPISGMVHTVFRQPGEYVTERDPLITIASPKADRVVAYIRQPYVFEPQVDMDVEVITRTRHRQKIVSKIVQIGAQVEAITNSLAFMRLGSLVDVGLPVVVSLPEGSNIRPGETVDVVLLRKGSASASSKPPVSSKATGLSRVP